MRTFYQWCEQQQQQINPQNLTQSFQNLVNSLKATQDQVNKLSQQQAQQKQQVQPQQNQQPQNQPQQQQNNQQPNNQQPQNNQQKV